MNLYSRILEGPKDRHLIVLHGLFGSSDNWQTAGKMLAESFTVHLLDMPNHGKSERTENMTYDGMADAVLEYAENAGLFKFWLVGHSMGGKAAMRFTQLYPERVVQLVVVDIGVKAYAPHHDFVFDAINKIDLSSVTSRKDVEDAIGREIADWTVQQFILKSLTRKPEGGYEWRTQFDILERNIHHILAEIPPFPVEINTLFIAGEKSNYITSNDHANLLKIFPKAEIITIEGSGHWVHAEKPNELVAAVKQFCQ